MGIGSNEFDDLNNDEVDDMIEDDDIVIDSVDDSDDSDGTFVKPEESKLDVKRRLEQHLEDVRLKRELDLY